METPLQPWSDTPLKTKGVQAGNIETASPLEGWSTRRSDHDRVDSQMTRKAFLIAVVMVLILFIGLFVGYRWGAAAALRDNAARPVATSPLT